MEGTSLFNPGFIGGSFIWWIGQVADDSSWRINLSEKQFEDPKAGVPGWGYRYKVRIIGHHDKDEAIIQSDQLPWAQCMYPVWGGGQGATYMTPGIKQGMFVFGFFMDGQDMQVPVIMGVLGNNAKTKLERKTGTEDSGENFTPQSFYSKNEDEEPNEQKKLKDANLATKNSNLSQESTDAVHQRTAADKKKDVILDRKHALACPDPDRQSDIKNINTVVETLGEKIQSFTEAQKSLEGAGGLPIVQSNKDINAAIEESSKEISKYMKGIMGQVQQFTTNEFNEKSMPMLNLAVPSYKNKIMEDQIAGLEKLACMFNGLAGSGLAALIAAALKNAFKRKKKQSQQNAANVAAAQAPVGVPAEQAVAPVPELDSPGSEFAPPLPQDGYYSPTPLCSTEELVGEILGENINTIMTGFDDALLPMVLTTNESLGGSSTESGSGGESFLATDINEDNVLASLDSGHLVTQMSSNIADGSGVPNNIIGNITNSFITGDYSTGLTNLFFLAGKDTATYQGAVADVVEMLKKGDIIGGFGAAAGILGASQGLMSGSGMVFDAIASGNTSELVNRVGELASGYPNILNSILGKGSSLAGPMTGGGIGALGGMNFDIAAAMGFVKTITKSYDCDPPPICSPNDTHTMQGGGQSADQPSNATAAQAAEKTADNRRRYSSGRTSMSSAEKKSLMDVSRPIKRKFKLPASRKSDLNSNIA